MKCSRSLIFSAAALITLSACSQQKSEQQAHANDPKSQMTADRVMANGEGDMMGNHGARSGMPVPGTNTIAHVIMNEHDTHQIKTGP